MFDTVDAAVPKPMRQLLIGVDAMEWTLVRRWAAEGKLPTLRRLMEQGLRAELNSPATILPDTVWTTLCHGVNPGKLEKYFYIQYEASTSSLRYAEDTELRGQPFWQYLSRGGKAVGVVDVPHLPFEEVGHGFCLMNWGAHDNKQGARSSPAPLLAEIEARFGSHPVGDCERYNQQAGAQARLRRDIVAGVHQHGELFRWLMKSRVWDVFVCCFSAAHCSGHLFWGHMDPSRSSHKDRAPDCLADTIEQSYRAIDREIGEMLALAGPDTRVMVFAPHGMGPLFHASWNVNEILDLLGYGSATRLDPPAGVLRTGKINPWRILKMLVPAAWQYRIKDMLPRKLQNQLVFHWYAGRLKFRDRRAFAVPNNEVIGAIRISVKGRDRNGLVNPGEEYSKICREIADALLELSDPASGRPVVKAVTLLQQVCHGPFRDRLPDLAVRWDTGFAWSSLYSPRFGTLRIRSQDRRTGSHTPNSFLLATGPGIPADAELKGCSTLDIAPTVLQAAGVPIPAEMDGQPMRLAEAM